LEKNQKMAVEQVAATSGAGQSGNGNLKACPLLGLVFFCGGRGPVAHCAHCAVPEKSNQNKEAEEEEEEEEKKEGTRVKRSNNWQQPLETQDTHTRQQMRFSSSSRRPKK
jgi:hypothetical protein